MVKFDERCFSYFTTGLAVDRASICNAYTITVTVNDWRLLCLRPSSDAVLLLSRTKLHFGSTVAQQEINFDSDLVPESNQIHGSLKPRPLFLRESKGL